MPQDAFTLRLAAKELNTCLKGGRINRINQPAKEEVSLLIYTGNRTLKLLLSANASLSGAYFYEEERENPLVAPNFCMLLRKHVQGAQILGVEMCGFERILAFRLLCSSDFSSCERVLYAEIMGKYSNLILTENGVILGALKTAPLGESTKRIIFAGAKYAFPAPQEKIDPRDLPALEAAFPSPVSARTLFLGVMGLAPCTAESIAESYRGGDFARHVHSYIFSDDISPRLLESGGAPVDFVARGSLGTPFPTLMEAESAFYAKKRQKGTREAATRKLLSAVDGAIKKHEKRLALVREKRLACADTETLRLKGELLIASLYAVPAGQKKCVLPNYYDEAGGTLEIALDPALSPSENAQSYFKRYRKQQRTLAVLGPQEEALLSELDYLSALRAAVVSAADELDLKCAEEECANAGLLPAPKARKKTEQALPFRSYEREGFRILAGRNNLQNDRLVRTGAPDDIWLHAQKYHSCHVLVKTEGKTPPKSVLQFAADLCAAHSDGGGDKLPVDYTLLKYVKKPKGAKAGFVTYTDFSTLLGNPEGIKE